VRGSSKADGGGPPIHPLARATARRTRDAKNWSTTALGTLQDRREASHGVLLRCSTCLATARWIAGKGIVKPAVALLTGQNNCLCRRILPVCPPFYKRYPSGNLPEIFGNLTLVNFVCLGC
jgi:hypothetical protein